jgi:hypothetical protein
MRGMKLPQFRLRTLFILLTIAAVAAWGYWFGRPRWILGREQSAFEASARQIKAGMTRNEWTKFVLWNNSKHPASHQYDSQHVRIGLTWVVWPNAIYCIYYGMPGATGSGDYDTPCSSVEVFRIPPVPTGYQSNSVKIAFMSKNFPDGELLSYMIDFLDYICGSRKNDPIFQYKLVYSDPPS